MKPSEWFLLIWFSALLFMAGHSYRESQELDAFVSRCEAKGGVALSGYRGQEKWIGCYAGFEELENEAN